MQSSTRYMSVHWVPKLLGPDQKQTQYNKGKCCHFGRSQQFLLEICEHIWDQVQHFQSAMMHQSKPWKHQDFLPPKKAKAMMCAGKVMACSTTLKRITLSPEPEPTTWSPSPETRRMLFHQDNAPAQTSTWLLSRNVDSNLLNTHSIQLTAPLTTFSSWLCKK